MELHAGIPGTRVPHCNSWTNNMNSHLFPHIGKVIASTGSRHFPRMLHDLILTQLAVDATHIRQMRVEPVGRATRRNEPEPLKDAALLAETLFSEHNTATAHDLPNPDPSTATDASQLHLTRRKDGYRYADGDTASTINQGRTGRLHILEVQRLIRFMPKIVICVVPGWAAGGGHSLHVVSDLTLASKEHARFKQTDADVASFDGGFGSAYLARQVGQKFAREIFFLGREYSADDAQRMGMVNAVVPHAELEATALQWAKEINSKSPTAQRMLKFSFNLIDDGLVGQQVFAGEATRLAYMTDEAEEGRNAFLEKRDPNWDAFPWQF